MYIVLKCISYTIKNVRNDKKDCAFGCKKLFFLFSHVGFDVTKNYLLHPERDPFKGLFTLKHIIEIKANHLKNGFKFKVYIS